MAKMERLHSPTNCQVWQGCRSDFLDQVHHHQCRWLFVIKRVFNFWSDLDGGSKYCLSFFKCHSGLVSEIYCSSKILQSILYKQSPRLFIFTCGAASNWSWLSLFFHTQIPQTGLGLKRFKRSLYSSSVPIFTVGWISLQLSISHLSSHSWY